MVYCNTLLVFPTFTALEGGIEEAMDDVVNIDCRNCYSFLASQY